jgi:hypothetical protein
MERIEGDITKKLFSDFTNRKKVDEKFGYKKNSVKDNTRVDEGSVLS